MKAYVIFDEDVYDLEGLQKYIEQAPPVLEQYGGKLLTAGGKIETLEGDWHPKTLVMLEFDSLEQAKRWYNSKEYTAVKALRQKSSNSEIVLVEGTDGIQV